MENEVEQDEPPSAMVTQNFATASAKNVDKFGNKVNLEERVNAIFLCEGYLSVVYVSQIVKRDVKRQVGADIEENLLNRNFSSPTPLCSH